MDTFVNIASGDSYMFGKMRQVFYKPSSF